MKNVLLYLMLAATLCLSACSDDNEILEPEYLEVSYASISGTWQLSEWNNAPLPEGCYCYLVIERKADEESGYRILHIYQNIDSGLSRHLTSDYWLEEDEAHPEESEDGLSAVIEGMYHHSAGFWNHTYTINCLLADRMTWTATDDTSDVSLYVRCDEVPADILAGTRCIPAQPEY